MPVSYPTISGRVLHPGKKTAAHQWRITAKGGATVDPLLCAADGCLLRARVPQRQQIQNIFVGRKEDD